MLESNDIIGDAYEHMIANFASDAGKKGGEFFTPADVSELLTRLGTVGKKSVNKVYDPACGSGSLLLKAEKILGKDCVTTGFYGQEINLNVGNTITSLLDEIDKEEGNEYDTINIDIDEAARKQELINYRKENLENLRR